jgi:hypothetical protein
MEQSLMIEVIKQIRTDIELGDTSALEALLQYVPKKKLYFYLEQMPDALFDQAQLILNLEQKNA